MSDVSKQDECLRIRDLAQESWESESFSAPDQESIWKHLELCCACRQWQEQSKDLLTAVRAMPQLDIDLSRQIMVAVEGQQERAKNSYREGALVAVLAAAAIGCLALDSFDTAAGWLSWSLSILGLVAFQAVFTAAGVSQQKAQ